MAGDTGPVSRGVTSAVKFRLARNEPADATNFCKLFNSLYARQVDESYYRWQHFEGPFPSGVVVAELPDGAWAGCYGFQIRPAANLRRPLAWSLDIMVAPQFQRQGLFRGLAEASAEEATKHGPAALCVMANAKADRAHVSTANWNRIEALFTYSRATSALPDLDEGFTHDLDQEFAWQPYARIGRGRQGGLVYEERSEACLRWRFVQSPWYRYSTVRVSSRGDSRAGAVVKTFRDPISAKSYGDIVDVVWTSEDPKLLRELLLAALHRFGGTGVATASTWLQTNTALDTVGKALGFARTEQTRYFCSKVLNPEFSRLELASNWFLTMSAAEIF